MLDLSEKVLQKRVWNQKVYESHVKNFMLGQTKEYLGKEKNTVDVGGAVGMYSFFFSQYSKHVHSFEAVPPVYKQLKANSKKAKNITTYNKAVSDHSGEASFFVDDKRLSNSSFQNLVNGQEIKVNVVSIDDMGFENVGFIKIDTEGTELEVVRGAMRTIERDRPNCMVEVYGEFSKYPPKDIFSVFFNRNYECLYNNKGEGLVKVDDINLAADIASDASMINVHDGDFLFVAK